MTSLLPTSTKSLVRWSKISTTQKGSDFDNKSELGRFLQEMYNSTRLLGLSMVVKERIIISNAMIDPVLLICSKI